MQVKVAMYSDAPPDVFSDTWTDEEIVKQLAKDFGIPESEVVSQLMIYDSEIKERG